MKWIHPNFPKNLFGKKDCSMGHTSIALLCYINYWVIQIASSLLSFTMKDQTSTKSSWLDCLHWSPTHQYSVNGPQVFLYSPSFIPWNLSWIFCQSTSTEEAEAQGWWCWQASSFSLLFHSFPDSSSWNTSVLTGVTNDLQDCCMIISELRPERHGQNKSTRTQIQIENVEKWKPTSWSFMSPSSIRALPVEQHSSKSTATFTEENMDEFPWRPWWKAVLCNLQISLDMTHNSTGCALVKPSVLHSFCHTGK